MPPAAPPSPQSPPAAAPLSSTLSRMIRGTFWLALKTPVSVVIALWSVPLTQEYIGYRNNDAYLFAWGFGYIQFLLEFGMGSSLQRQMVDAYSRGDRDGVNRTIACGMNFYATVALIQMAVLLGIAYFWLPPKFQGNSLVIGLLWVQILTTPFFGMSTVVGSVLQAARRYDFIPRLELAIVVLRFGLLALGYWTKAPFLAVVIGQLAIQIGLSLGPGPLGDGQGAGLRPALPRRPAVGLRGDVSHQPVHDHDAVERRAGRQGRHDRPGLRAARPRLRVPAHGLSEREPAVPPDPPDRLDPGLPGDARGGQPGRGRRPRQPGADQVRRDPDAGGAADPGDAPGRDLRGAVPGLWVGPKFVPDAWMLQLFLVATLPLVLSVLTQMAIGMGKIKVVAISSLVGALLNLPMSWYLTRAYGVSGVIWGTVLTTLFSNLLVPGVYLFRVLEIRPSTFLRPDPEPADGRGVRPGGRRAGRSARSSRPTRRACRAWRGPCRSWRTWAWGRWPTWPATPSCPPAGATSRRSPASCSADRPRTADGESAPGLHGDFPAAHDGIR